MFLNFTWKPWLQLSLKIVSLLVLWAMVYVEWHCWECEIFKKATDPVAKPSKPCCEMFSERELESLEPKLYLGGLYGLSIYHREFRVIMRMLNVCLTFVNEMRNVGYVCEMIRALQF